MHRDIKPENLLLDDRDMVKIADFGVSVVIEEDKALAVGTIGTPAYSAPEIWNRTEIHPELCDIYSLGATLYAMMVGKPPYIAQNEVCVMADVDHCVVLLETYDND